MYLESVVFLDYSHLFKLYLARLIMLPNSSKGMANKLEESEPPSRKSTAIITN